MGVERFLPAQDRSYSVAFQEIKMGEKQSHWIWYVFPQLKGLGHSHKSHYYGIADEKEAREYWEHPVLRQRLVDISNALLEQRHQKTIVQIFGAVDALKVKSCMTLFLYVTREHIFKDVLDSFFDGNYCNYTMTNLQSQKNREFVSESSFLYREASAECE